VERTRRAGAGSAGAGEKNMTSPVSPSHPTSAIDPFSREFLSDPYPFHHQLREAGPAVWLERHSIWAVARYEEVFRTLSDWQTFCSSRGVGLADFGKEPPRPSGRQARCSREIRPAIVGRGRC
jgi:cytochrome P450